MRLIPLLLLIVSCTSPDLRLPSMGAGEVFTPHVDFPGSDIWAELYAAPGPVSDLDPAIAGPSHQTRQLPSGNLSAEILGPGLSRLHRATVDALVMDSDGHLVGYWMEGDTITPGGLPIPRCRFFAGVDSYPRFWYHDPVTGATTYADHVLVNPQGRRFGAYAVGAVLTVSADLDPTNTGRVARWWFD